MLKGIFGSESKEQVLLFIVARGSGYSRQIADFFSCSVTPIRNQLESLEETGILVSQAIGRTRVYSMNPRNPFRKEIEALIHKMFTFMTPQESQRLLYARTRPRRRKKPL